MFRHCRATIGPACGAPCCGSGCGQGTYLAAWGAVNHLRHWPTSTNTGRLPECVALLVSGVTCTYLLHVRRSVSRSSSWAAPPTTPPAAYDKAARLPGLGYPGGKAPDDLARTGDRDAIVFPRGMSGSGWARSASPKPGTVNARYVESHAVDLGFRNRLPDSRRPSRT